MIQSESENSERDQRNIRTQISLLIQRARSVRYEDVSKSPFKIKVLKIFAIIAAALIDLYRITRRKLSWIIKTPAIFIDRYRVEEFSHTILYTSDEDLFPEYPFRAGLIESYRQVKVSLTVTEKNEIRNTRKWIDSIFRQTRLPDELVIVDAGSTDGTYDLLNKVAQDSPFPIKIIHDPGLNIAQGRNLAISKAEFPIIAVTDFGCRPESDWLEKLIAPFEQDDHIQASGGWYVAEDSPGNVLNRRAWPRMDQIDPAGFIPSSRSFAFTREIWEKVGGYPEWLTLTGEDTYFALEIRKYCEKRAFVPEAVVHWEAPTGILNYWKKMYYWSTGDGESGLHGLNYWYSSKLIIQACMGLILGLCLLTLMFFFHSIILYVVFALYILTGSFILLFYATGQAASPAGFIAEVGAHVARVMGYIKGFGRRKVVDSKRLSETKGIFFILAGVPIQDTGGGSRGAQIAFELIRQHYFVVYIHKYDSYESIDLGLHFTHPNLLVFPLNKFSWKRFEAGHHQILMNKKIGVLIEFALGEFIPLINQLKTRKATICYDLLDNWDSQLGSAWYKDSIEKQVIAASDVLVATATNLIDDLESKSSQKVHLVPNAVNLRLFNAYREYRKPDDLPPSEFLITYIGALWGEWFDWGLLIKVAKSFPTATVMVIGDYRQQCPESISNMVFLGLKPQILLPAYLAYTKVAIIPWKENDITYSTSPLKLYEYLAMHVPVVVPDLPLLYDIPYVFASKGIDHFIANVTRAANEHIYQKVIDEFISQNCWENRVKKILDLMGLYG